MSAIDTSAVAAAKPDVIIATGDLDAATYERLRAIAPTIAAPQGSGGVQAWNWQTQLTWIGRIFGRQTEASERISAVQSVQTDLRNQNPAFVGKSVEAVMVSDAGVAEVLAPSNAADYLESLGLRYSQRLQRTAVDISATRPVADPTQIYAIESDVLVVIRTDRLAGRGGYDGLPRQPPLSGRQPVTAHHLRADAATRVRRRPRGAAVRVLCIALPARVMRRWPRLICL